jgi:hypothetical protein
MSVDTSGASLSIPRTVQTAACALPALRNPRDGSQALFEAEDQPPTRGLES